MDCYENESEYTLPTLVVKRRTNPTVKLTLTKPDANGVKQSFDLNADNETLKFTVKTSPYGNAADDSDAVFRKDVTAFTKNSDGTENYALIVTSSDDSSPSKAFSDLAVGEYVYDYKLTSMYVKGIGKLKVTVSVTGR